MTEHQLPKIEKSSGNVFKDLGLPDAENLLTKTDLALQIAHLAKARGFDGTGTARVLGIAQPKASLLLRGRTDGFSTEKLLHYLTMLGQDVRIVISDKPASVPKGRLLVQIRPPRTPHRSRHKAPGVTTVRRTRKASRRRLKHA
jgi:predicted XRE-type DNA-binding protein